MAARLLGRAVDEPTMARMLAAAVEFPVSQRADAVEKYEREGHKPGEHSPKYLLAMIRSGAAPRHRGRSVHPPEPRWKMDGFESEAAYLAARDRIRHEGEKDPAARGAP